MGRPYRNAPRKSGLARPNLRDSELQVLSCKVFSHPFFGKIWSRESRLTRSISIGYTTEVRHCELALFKFQCFPVLIQGFSTMQVILSALIQDFSSAMPVSYQH